MGWIAVKNTNFDASKMWSSLKESELDFSKIWDAVKRMEMDLAKTLTRFVKAINKEFPSVKEYIDISVTYEGSKNVITISILKQKVLKIIVNRKDYSLSVQYKT